MDSNITNTALVLTSNDVRQVPDIDISPAYDLDLSFNISKELSLNGKMNELNGIDGQHVNLKTFIQEFIDVCGFDTFLSDFYRKILDTSVPNQIIKIAIEKTNFDFLKENNSQYISFLKSRFQEVKKVYEDIFMNNRGGNNKHETVLEWYKK